MDTRPLRLAGERIRSRRRFDYDRRLLPNELMAELEPEGVQSEDAKSSHGAMSLGYPAWNLLYYTLFCSLVPEQKDAVLIETGTNHGISTIVIAQALKDLGLHAVVETVEVNESLAAVARENIERAGLSEYVRSHVADATEFLSDLVERVDHIDFVMLDDDHSYKHLMQEIRIVCPRVIACRGKMYFDNAAWGGVAQAVTELRKIHGGNLIEFANCSWWPPGNCIWQPD